MKVVLFHDNEGIAIHDVDQNYSKEQINAGRHVNGKLPDWNVAGILVDE